MTGPMGGASGCGSSETDHHNQIQQPGLEYGKIHDRTRFTKIYCPDMQLRILSVQQPRLMERLRGLYVLL
jgi:hypothetical protein